MNVIHDLYRLVATLTSGYIAVETYRMVRDRNLRDGRWLQLTVLGDIPLDAFVGINASSHTPNHAGEIKE